MVINKTSEYDKNVKEIAMMEFRTPEELHALPSPRYYKFSLLIIT